LSKPTYPIYLTEEELKAIPVLLNMAMVYSWELYNKTESDKFYKQHKENIDMIKDYHDQGFQGILAVGSFIERKVNVTLSDMKLFEILKPYINNKIESEIIETPTNDEYKKATEESFKREYDCKWMELKDMDIKFK
jgi:hypothetical protein